jgi:hypothetical protein
MYVEDDDEYGDEKDEIEYEGLFWFGYKYTGEQITIPVNDPELSTGDPAAAADEPDFVEAIPHGAGKLEDIRYDASLRLALEGTFVNGKPHGLCKVVDIFGEMREVEFEAGKPIGPDAEFAKGFGKLFD